MDFEKQMQFLLNDLGNDVGLEDLALDQSGYCCLAFDETIVVNLEMDSETGRVVLYSFIGELPGDPADENRSTLYETLLEANFFWRQTGGATIGIDKESESIVLTDAQSLELLDTIRFKEMLRVFVNTAETWMARLGKGEPEAEESPEMTFNPEAMA